MAAKPLPNIYSRSLIVMHDHQGMMYGKATVRIFFKKFILLLHQSKRPHKSFLSISYRH